MVVKIEHDASGKVTGVVYADAQGAMHRQKARVVAVAGNSLESPRLLLNSESAKFPDGLANSSGQVGAELHAAHGPATSTPPSSGRCTCIAAPPWPASNDPSRGFFGGYEMETISLGVPFMAAFLDPGAWGRSFTSVLDDYTNMAGMWLIGEDMPQETNRVTLDPVVKDKNGLPVASVHFDDHANDIAMRNHAIQQGSAIYEAVGAVRILPTPALSEHPQSRHQPDERTAAGRGW
ncbi:MAG: hypothetical protein WDN49_25050 [Acetobacteraceae bacterium]